LWHASKLVERVGSAWALFDAGVEAENQWELEVIQAARQFSTREDDQTTIEADALAWHERGFHLTTVLDNDYPVNLRFIWDRPPFLFFRGKLQRDDAFALAVVGTRNPSDAGRKRTSKMAALLVESGVTVLSERELSVARHAARGGAPVVQPSDLLPPGPHRRDGHTLVFWNYLAQAGELDAAAAGRGLHTIHDALADYDGELPRAGRAEEVRAMLAPFAPSYDVELLCELASRELPVGQALHGDAHLFNCIQTPAGPIWHDLETACRGPREYDLAALVLRDRSRDSDPEARIATAAYGYYDEDLLEQALPVYASWVAASFMAAVARRPDAAPALERQLHFLRGFRR
jgi:hypothetical protein